MIWSGLLIYWAYDPFRVGGFHFFPQWFYKGLGIPFQLARGMALHFFAMWLFAINGLLYVLYTLISGEWRYLVPTRPRVFAEAYQVMLYDLGIRKTAPPHQKYNAAQQVSYSAIIVMAAGSLLTGLAIYKPLTLHWLTAMFGGYGTARALHFALTIGYVLFFAVHIIQVLRAGWNNFRSMVIGYEVLTDAD